MNPSKLPVEPSGRRGRNGDADAHQADALLVRQQALVLLRRGKAALVGAEDEKIFRIAAALRHQCTDGHTIERGRNAADLILTERRAEHCEEVLRGADAFSENTVGLLQNRADRTVDLGVFLRAL